jgi:dihydroorotase
MKILLLKQGTVVSSKEQKRVDLLIKDGKIVEMAEEILEEGVDEVVDCLGKFILPGVIDPHVHFRTPGHEHKEDWNSGTAAAVAGGVTTVLDMPNNNPAVTTREILKAKRELLQGKSRVNYGLYMGGTMISETGETNIDEYVNSDAIGLKVYMGSSTGSLLADRLEVLETIFSEASNAGRMVCVHAEDEVLMKEREKMFEGQDDPSIHAEIRNEEVATRAVKVALDLAKQYGTRLHVCHMSTAGELKLLEAARKDGVDVTCEVSPHHLFADKSELKKQGTYARMNPPLRSAENLSALMEGIRSGAVNMIATDHAPHTHEEKDQNYWKAPSGVPGVETALPLMLDAVSREELQLEDLVRVMCEGPADRFELKGKGKLEVGMDADVTVVDMGLEQMVENGGPGARFTKVQWSLFKGRSLKGWPVMTIVNGEILLKDGKISDKYVGIEIN